MTYDKDLIMPFGKHAGKKMSEVSAKYLIDLRWHVKSLEYGLRNYIDQHMTELSIESAQSKTARTKK